MVMARRGAQRKVCPMPYRAARYGGHVAASEPYITPAWSLRRHLSQLHAPSRTARPRRWSMKLFDAAPEYGEPVALDEGLWWLRLQLPFALNHVNLVLAEDDDGWTAVDTGLGDA